MKTHRLRFSKTGKAVYISHLDLMRTFQRAFMRAGLSLKHSEGFNPHAQISMLLPLSVGVSSLCEVMDFQLLDDIDMDELPARLNAVMPAGIHVESASEAVKKAAELKFVRCRVELEYDAGNAAEAAAALRELLTRQSLPIMKKTKRGERELDMAECMSEPELVCEGENLVVATVTLTAQDPVLTPDYIVKAAERYIPEYAPDFARFTRLEVYDADMAVFR